MPSCGSQGSYDCSDEQQDSCNNVGQLDYGAVTATDSWSAPSKCDGSDIYSDYEISFATTAHDDVNEAYDEVANEKRWWPVSHFSNKPDPLVDNNACSHGAEPYCEAVEYLVEQGSGSTNTIYDYEFKDPIPDGDPNDGDGIIADIARVGLVFGGYYFGGRYGSALGGLIAPYIPDPQHDPVDLDQGTYDNGQRHSWHWDINMTGTGYGSFPLSPCESTGVQFRINDLSGAGTNHTTDLWTRYNIGYPSYSDNCRCDWNSNYVVKTTFRAFNACEWASVA